MKSLPLNLLLGILLLTTGLFAFSAQPANPYDRELQEIRASIGSASYLEKLVLMDRVFHLRDYVDDPASVSRIFEEITKQDAEDQTALVRAEAEAYLSDVGVLLGEASSPQGSHWYQDAARRAKVLAEAAEPLLTAENLELLAELEHIAGKPEAVDHMLQAVQLEATASRWARVAALSDDPFKKFAALQAGLAIEPTNATLCSQLALYYVGRQQLEKAQALLQTALAARPDDFVLGEQLAGVYLNLGLRSAALRQSKRLEQQLDSSLRDERLSPPHHAQNQEARVLGTPVGPRFASESLDADTGSGSFSANMTHSPPIWLRARLAMDYEQIGLLDNAARLAASVVQEKSTDREQLQLLVRFHQKRGMVPELEADYSALLRLQPNSADLLFRLAKLQFASGDLSTAKESFLRVIKLDATNAEAHRQLAAIYQQLDLPQAADQELAAATTSSPGSIVAADPDSRLLSNAKAIAAEAFRHPPKEDDLALSDIRIQELYKNGLSRLHIQQIFYVGSEAAISAHRRIGIRYSPGSEAVRVFHARVWKTNGKVLDAQEDGETLVGDSTTAMYYDTRSRRLRFIGVEKGDVVEVEYEVSPTLKASPYSGYFGELVTLAGRTPARLKRYALIVPAAQPIFAHAEKVSPATTIAGNNLRTLVWDVHDVAAIPREPHSPGITETSPYVHVSTMENWEKLGEWYAELIRPQFALDQSLKVELERITRGKTSDEEKIAAIQEFVLRGTHYVAMEFGIYSYKPYPVSQTYLRRFGDCKDKASLMIALLRAAGIDADIALLRTRPLGDIAPTPASVAIFDHAIVYIPKYKLWLDGTAEYSGSELPQDDQGAMALTVSLSGAAQLRQIPVSSAQENYTKRTIHAELTPEGVIRFNGSTLTRGKDAPRLRRDLAVPEQQLGLFRDDLAEVFPTVEVDSVAVHGERELGSQVSVDFQGALNALQHKSVVTLNSSWLPRSYVSNLAPTISRTQDLVLNLPSTTEEEIHVDLPSGSVVRQFPKDEEINTSFGSVRLHYIKSSHEIVIQSHLEFQKGRISAQDYPAFRQFCSTLERSFRNEIVVGLAR